MILPTPDPSLKGGEGREETGVIEAQSAPITPNLHYFKG
jgi:hypothetical protein